MPSAVAGGGSDGAAGEEFDAVPLDGVVGSGDDDAGVGGEMLDHHGDAGGGDDFEVDDFDAAGGEGADDDVADPGSAGTGIAAEGDAEVAAVGGGFVFLEPGGEGGGHLHDDGGGEGAADRAAGAGYTDHQYVHERISLMPIIRMMSGGGIRQGREGNRYAAAGNGARCQKHWQAMIAIWMGGQKVRGSRCAHAAMAGRRVRATCRRALCQSKADASSAIGRVVGGVSSNSAFISSGVTMGVKVGGR